MGRVGSINYEWVGPRYISSQSVGELEAEEAGAFMEIVAENVQGEPYFLWEIDVRNLTGMTAEARRVCADHLRVLPDRAIAVVGGQFAQRILTKLVLTAVAILDKSQRNNEVSFFADSASAKQWLENYARSYEARISGT